MHMRFFDKRICPKIKSVVSKDYFTCTLDNNWSYKFHADNGIKTIKGQMKN